MMVDLDPFDAIVAVHAIASSYDKAVAHYREKGVPGFMRQATRQSLDGHRDGHATLIAALRAEGYIMRDDDLPPVDHDELLSKEWISA